MMSRDNDEEEHIETEQHGNSDPIKEDEASITNVSESSSTSRANGDDLYDALSLSSSSTNYRGAYGQNASVDTATSAVNAPLSIEEEDSMRTDHSTSSSSSCVNADVDVGDDLDSARTASDSARGNVDEGEPTPEETSQSSSASRVRIVINSWRDKLRSMVLKARDGRVIILQQRKSMMEREKSTAVKDDVQQNNLLAASLEFAANKTTFNAQNENSTESSLEHGAPADQEVVWGMPLDGEERVLPTIDTTTTQQQQQQQQQPREPDSSSVNSSTSTGSWSISWPRPGAYFVRYARRHRPSDAFGPLSNRQRRDATMAAHHSTMMWPFAQVVDVTINNFPYAIPILDDEDPNVVRVQGVEYDHDEAARMIKRRRMRLYTMMTTILSVMLLMFGAVGVTVVVVLTKRKANITTPTSVQANSSISVRPRAPSKAPISPYYSTTLHFEPYLHRFAKVVGNNLVFQNGTSHRIAANWIFYSDPLQLPVTNEHLIQRYLLALFYFQMSNNGKSKWQFCGPSDRGQVDSCLSMQQAVPLVSNDDEYGFQYFRWLSGKHECNWMGATCDAGNVVRGLQLNGQGMRGTLPTELTVLTSLQSLSLSSNYINGTIPSDYFRLANLVKLNLQDNLLSGTLSEMLYQATELRSLNVASNTISGNLSTKLGVLRNLTELQLFDNDMTGTVPTEIGILSRLSILTLNHNAFQGDIPTEIGRLSSLTQLLLGENRLEGTLPSELGLLTSMTDLQLSRNLIGGTIPEEFYNLTKLQKGLDLQEMELNGTLSTKIGLLTSLQALFIGKNHLYGNIPSQLANLNYLATAFFGLNDFKGPIPRKLCQRDIELQADCAPKGHPPQECSCCTSCCDRLTGNCSLNNIFGL